MTVEFPFYARQASFSWEYVDAGFTQRGLTNNSYIPRKGSRYRVLFVYGPHWEPSEIETMHARLIRGKQEGLRVPLPLINTQGNPGAPLVDGAVVTGRVLPLKGMIAGYVVREGYWLSIVIDGQHYLHCVEVGGMVNASGNLTITLTEMLREELAGDEVVHLAKPMVEGLVTADTVSGGFDLARTSTIEFTIEERA